MQRLEVSGAVRLIYGSLGVKRLRNQRGTQFHIYFCKTHFTLPYKNCATLRYPT